MRLCSLRRSGVRSRGARRGFTLLEVLLASLIAILLLSALYFAMDITLRQTQESREALDVENRARGVFLRMTIDLSHTLGPLPPKSGGNSASGASYSAPTTEATDATGMAPTDPTAGGIPTAPADPAAAPAPTDPAAVPTDGSESEVPVQPQAAAIEFQAGLIGEEKQLTVFVSRLPGALANTGELFMPSDPNLAGTSDLWRITYWLGSTGLCRQETPWVTADGVRNATGPDLTDEVRDTLVSEVTDLRFEYFDGVGWMTSWYGDTPGPDGLTPIGPPRAVKVTLTFEIAPSRPGGATITKTVQQVIPIRTGPGPNTPTMLDPSTDPGTVTPEDPASTGDTGGTPSGGGAAAGASGMTTPAGGGAPPVPPTGGGAGGQPSSGGGRGGAAPAGGGGRGGPGGGR